MQIKPTMKYHYTPIRRAAGKSLATPSLGKSIKQLELMHCMKKMQNGVPSLENRVILFLHNSIHRYLPNNIENICVLKTYM